MSCQRLTVRVGAHGCLLPGGSVELLDADQVACGIAQGAVANAVRVLGRLLDDLGAGLQPCEGSGSPGCGLPREPVRVGEGPGIAVNREPVRSAAVGRDTSIFGQGPVPVERQLHRTGRRGELDVLAAKAFRHGEAAPT